MSIFSFEFCEISEDTFSYRRPLEAASAVMKHNFVERRRIFCNIIVKMKLRMKFKMPTFF